MPDTELTQQQKDELLKTLLAERAASNGASQHIQPAGGMASQFQQRQAQPQGLPAASAVLVPLEMIDQAGGRVEVYLTFDPSYASDIDGLLRTLSAAGVPLKVWKPKNRNGYNGNGGNGNSGGRGYGSGNGGGGGYGG